MSSHDLPQTDDNKLIAERREKLAALRSRGGVVFPNDFKPTHDAADLQLRFGQLPNEELEPQAIAVAVAGRLMLKRVMGKASFGTLQDASFGPTQGRIQLYVSKADVGDEAYDAFKHNDLGDILGAQGLLFRTRSG
jgi:lysyl-tRNA synthetase class 2